MAVKAYVHHATLPAPAPAAWFTLSEGISRLFELEAEFLVEDPEVDLEGLLHGAVEVEVALGPEDVRTSWHAVVAEATYVAPFEKLHRCRLRARPRVAALEHRVRTRIFQDLPVVDVVREVLRGAGVPAELTRWAVHRRRSRREYVTQWKESELAFVLRLLEESGIAFWFDRDPDAGHVMRLVDAGAAHPPIDGDAALACAEEPHDEGGVEWVTDLAFALRPSAEAYETRDWNPDAPVRPVTARAESGRNPALELYEFPARVATDAEAHRAASLRLAAARVRRDVLTGVTNCTRLQAGRTFDLVDALPEELCTTWLLTEVTRRFEDRSLLPGGATGARYRASFAAVPASTGFHPERRTPRPRALSKESAVVTGPPGEEIHVDRMGRVKVHFYWDREGKIDDRASCWLRVQQQNTAGNSILPRVGWEVDVGFLGADPDRPVVLQKLYNAEGMPPYALPDHLTHTALQSSSSPGGGGTNEIRMNDSHGAMEFFVHSQKDLALQSGSDLAETVAENAKLQVGADARESVVGNEEVQVGGNRSLTVKGSRVAEVLANLEVQVGGADDLGVGSLYTVKVGKSAAETVGAVRTVLAAKINETVNGNRTSSVGGALSWAAAAGPITEAVSGSKAERIGGARIELLQQSKAEVIGKGKTLTAGLVKTDAGKDLSVAAETGLAVTTGGPSAIKCDGDFALSAATVTLVAGKADLVAGGAVHLTPASIVLEGGDGKVSGSAPKVLIKGQVKYVAKS